MIETSKSRAAFERATGRELSSAQHRNQDVAQHKDVAQHSPSDVAQHKVTKDRHRAGYWREYRARRKKRVCPKCGYEW